MASITYIPSRTLLLSSPGRRLRVKVPGFSTRGNTAMSITRARMDTTAMTTNVILHPRARPIILPSGRPAIIAMDVPVATVLSASFWSSGATTRTANGVAMDQNIEWATATPIRETMSIM